MVLSVAPIEDVSLSAYRAEEERLNALNFGWRVTLTPPFQQCIAVGGAGDASVDDAVWALQHWGVARINISGADAETIIAPLANAGLQASASVTRASGAQLCAAALNAD